MTVTLPGLLPIRNLFEDLLNREIDVIPGDPTKADDLPTTLVAIYVDNAGAMVAVLGLNLPLAAHAGAAFGLMPVGAAEAALEDKALSPALVENVAELANIFGSLLNREGGPHVKLYQVIPPGEPIPGDAAAHLLALGRRLDVKLAIARYGSGRLALALTD